MPCTICFDTNVFLQFRSNADKTDELRKEYDSIIETKTVLTKWKYVVFTGHQIVLSPLASWEFTSVKLRELIQNESSEEMDYTELMEKIRIIDEKFNKKQPVDKMNLAIALLFAGATGVPCDDAYHFIHATRNNIDIFATENKKHFSMVKKVRKEDIIEQMRQILKRCKPVEILENEDIAAMIQELSEIQWPNIVFQSADVPIE